MRDDIDYLVGTLPQMHVNGVTGGGLRAWNAAARRLKAQVPRLSDGQVIIGVMRMVALLRDDETLVYPPAQPLYPFRLAWIDRGLYLSQVLASDRDLLGGRLLAIDGHPIAAVLAKLRPVVDYQDVGVLAEEEAGGPWGYGLLNNADVLSWLNVTRSARAEELTVRTRSAGDQTVRLAALTSGQIGQARFDSFPAPGFLDGYARPFWLRVLPGRRTVYLKYNQCLTGPGFGRIARRALDDVRRHRGYRLIVDLRDNPGGDTGPFQALIAGIRADPKLNRRGLVFGLINGFTDSSATGDAANLRLFTKALMIGTEVMDPIDEYGNDNQTFTLPFIGVTIQSTTAVVNPSAKPLVAPDIVVAPTLSDLEAGSDPVLAEALRYGRRG